MEKLGATMGAQGAGGGQGAGGAGGGNGQLQAAFDQAIQQASETLAISTKGQATLNALRARPN